MNRSTPLAALAAVFAAVCTAAAAAAPVVATIPPLSESADPDRTFADIPLAAPAAAPAALTVLFADPVPAAAVRAVTLHLRCGVGWRTATLPAERAQFVPAGGAARDLAPETLPALAAALAAAEPSDLPEGGTVEGTDGTILLFLEDGFLAMLRAAVPDETPDDALVGFREFVVTAVGGGKAAAIGAGFWRGVDIVISRVDEVIATGGKTAAAIGSSRNAIQGDEANPDNPALVTNIHITDSNIN